VHTALTVLFTASVVFLVVPMAVLPLVGRRALRLGNGQATERLARATRPVALASMISGAAGLGAIATFELRGAYSLFSTAVSADRLVEDMRRSLNAPELLSFGVDWVWAVVVLYAAALLVTLVVVVPALRAAGAALSAGRIDRLPYRRVATGSELVFVLLALAALLVLLQP